MKTKIDILKTWIPSDNQQNLPNFLRQRVNGFYQNRVMESWRGGHIMRGLSPNENSVIISNNDYLSLKNHPDIVQGQINSLTKNGVGVMMSSVFLHGENEQTKFEEKMAKFLQAEDVLTTQSGWCANTGLVQSIADKHTVVYIDMMAHMSLWEGIQSANAIAKVFRHNDANHLEKLIKRYGSGVIIVDSIYSTNGDICPLKDVIDLTQRYDCILVVDESHSLGTHGEHGEGMIAALGLADKVHFRTASLAKAFCGRGGIIVCSKRHKQYLMCESRPAIFSSAVLPHDLVGFTTAIDVIKREAWRRVRLHHNADFVRKRLQEQGYNVSASKSQIIALESGTEQQTMILRDALEKKDIFGSVFCAPATPKNRALIRFSINAGLTQEELEKIVAVCAEIREEVNMKNWPSTLRMQRHQAATLPKVFINRAHKALDHKPAKVLEIARYRMNKSNKRERLI